VKLKVQHTCGLLKWTNIALLFERVAIFPFISPISLPGGQGGNNNRDFFIIRLARPAQGVQCPFAVVCVMHPPAPFLEHVLRFIVDAW
jgi:hypothetical protein